MKSFFLTKNYNALMVLGILISSAGIETLADGWIIGLIMIVVGAVIYFASDREPSETVPSTPVPETDYAVMSVDPSLLPIEWSKAFDESVAPIPSTFIAALHKPDTRL